MRMGWCGLAAVGIMLAAGGAAPAAVWVAPRG